MPTTARPARRALAVLFLLAGVAFVAGCGSSSGGSDASSSSGSGGSTTTAAPGGSDTTTTEAATTTTAASGGGDLAGDWTADAGDLLSANTANLGGASSVDCSGPIVLHFGGDGAFTQSGDISCTVGGMTATGSIDTTGSWSTSGDTLTVSGATSKGSITVGSVGITQPIDAGISDGQGTYAIDGDTLTLTFTDPSVGTVSQSYTRA